MLEQSGQISLEYLRKIPWTDSKRVTLTPSGHGLLVNERVLFAVTAETTKVTIHVTRPREWFVIPERTLKKGGRRSEGGAVGEIRTRSIGIGRSPGEAVYIEGRYKVTHIGREEDSGGVILAIQAREPIHFRPTEAVNMRNTEANEYLRRIVMASQ